MRSMKAMIAVAAALLVGVLLLAPALTTAQTASGVSNWPNTAVVPMTSNQEPNLTTPIPANSNPMGATVLQMTNGSSQICYSVWVSGVSNITQAHIHLGAAGQEGPVVAWLFPSTKVAQANASLNSTNMPGNFTGLLAKGNITAADLVGPMQGKSIADLMAAIWSGQTYVNVHSTQNPGGEIRGQITSANIWSNALAVPLTTREEPQVVNLTSGGTLPPNMGTIVNLTGVNLKSEPFGLAVFQWNNVTNMLHYGVWAWSLQNVTLVHIDQGARGVKGQAIAPIWPVNATSNGTNASQGMMAMVNGKLVEGNISVAQLTGMLQGQNFTALVADLQSGATYVNVHTTQNPSGELRGQIDPTNLTCAMGGGMNTSSMSTPTNTTPSGNQPSGGLGY